ncbi:3'5'-cyclic nucleotide phosphodiesterase [Haematococcus lacustris]|uniref:3'5'-cyclic nucleotide phosphodiesterase n=1 Tax=Haematococcus lacustris TaxID=44745 RepID=A0A699ZWZ3_HAELA|nr:3'5'-cyclic nucleotide phosphodiesterase [Haematococcus lacustris]
MVNGLLCWIHLTGTLAAYLAAAVHDVQHKGLNNDFLIKSSDKLALLYNDISPMENHHLATTFTLLSQEPLNFLARTPRKMFDAIRKVVINMVLATDMRGHFSSLSLFKSKLHLTDEPNASIVSQRPSDSGGHTVAGGFHPNKAKQWTPVALKCADIGHLAAQPEVHRRWVLLLEEELFRQGDREAASGLPVSALMDRSKAGITKSQTGFLNIVALPLFKAMAKAFPAMEPLLAGVQVNYEAWRLEEEAEKAAEKAADKGTDPK